MSTQRHLINLEDHFITFLLGLRLSDYTGLNPSVQTNIKSVCKSPLPLPLGRGAKALVLQFKQHRTVPFELGELTYVAEVVGPTSSVGSELELKVTH